MNTGLAEPSTRGPLDPATRPWLAQYAAGVPATLAYPEITLPQAFAEVAARFADRPALAYYGRTITYRQLARAVAQFANRLRQLGLRQGDRALLMLPNLPQFVIAHFGTLLAGGVVAPISPLLVDREVEHAVRHVEPKIAVVFDGCHERLAGLHARGLVERVVLAHPDEYLPPHQRLLYPLTTGAIPRVPDDPARGRYRFRRLLAGADARPPAVDLAPGDLAMLPFTGGTTGLPKAVMLTHRNLLANSLQIRHWIPALRPGREVELAIVPLFHAFGLTVCLHMATLLGAELVLLPRFTVGEALAAIRAHRPTVFPGVPMLYATLNAAVHDDPAKVRALASLRHSISGAASLPAPIQEEFERLTGSRLVEGYGLTEASPVALANPCDGRARPGSIGLPLPDTEARLVDPASGADASPGGPGELALRGPQVMQGYWRHPEETTAVLRGGWLHTGDIATMDEDGYFRIVDRTKDVIITGGEKIYPREIEEALYTHPKVQDVVVVGVPHAVGGQVPKAYIVPRPGATLTRREVVQYCAERLAKYKVPRQVEFRDSLPKTLLGKVLRRALQEEERREADT